ncbi:MAG: excinuclease ABC subunit UvrA [Sphingobacteriales bacterium]|jgi:excinuclease ABC subunit A|nr:MAG: excinuclease ABC subunit UvrA [Sphingobacteriales bacterium]
MQQKLTKPNELQRIIVKGARMHNLKNIDVEIPRNKLIVITGVSGSGKSSLTIDTIYAEGQRRYVESLSSYARQFMARMDKPDVDYIKGLSPAIAIEQKTTTGTTRSTVGTLTEIYDYLKLLYAKIGRTYSPITGNEVIKHDVDDVINYIKTLPSEQKIQILAPIKNINQNTITNLRSERIQRLYINNDVVSIDDIDTLDATQNTYTIIDRLTADSSEDNLHRIADSVQFAFSIGNGNCTIDVPSIEQKHFSNSFDSDGIQFEIPSVSFFNFNSPYGACPTCEGFGTILGIDHDLVIPDKTLSFYEDAVVCWKSDNFKPWKKQFIKGSSAYNFPIHRPIIELDKEQYNLLWNGGNGFMGISDFFKDIENQTYKIQYRVLLSKYRGRATCTSCHGSRLRPDTNYVKIQRKDIGELLSLSIRELKYFFDNLELNTKEAIIAKRILIEIKNRLQFMTDVGLEYLTLNRFSNTLSGGEAQRINLTRSLGSNLTDSLYILDEPSVGLHPHDSSKLINILKYLRDLGNTVIVVEHEEEIMHQADYIVDVGPFAGYLGGEIIFAGSYDKIIKDKKSLTAKYLNHELNIELPKTRRKAINYIEFKGIYHHNIKNIDIKIPLQAITAVTGVSGSGKTTLIKHVIYPALKSLVENLPTKGGLYKSVSGYKNNLTQIEFIDQNPIGRSSRSNPITYIKAYDAIRDLYSKQNLSKIRGYQPKHFSFNVDGGRCDACEGEGEQVIEMQFLADVHLKCESCNGTRFKSEILEVTYKDKNIAEILSMSVDTAMEFFEHNKDIINKIKPLQDVGLGYIQLGQSSSTLSGGEAQRVKLASFLGRGNNKGNILFIFDEPTTGLHFHDIHKLMAAFNALIDNGHSIIVIEHNVDVIKCADWLIDLGPKGGAEGGKLIFQGVTDDIVNAKESITAKYLKSKLKK